MKNNHTARPCMQFRADLAFELCIEDSLRASIATQSEQVAAKYTITRFLGYCILDGNPIVTDGRHTAKIASHCGLFEELLKRLAQATGTADGIINVKRNENGALDGNILIHDSLTGGCFVFNVEMGALFLKDAAQTGK